MNYLELIEFITPWFIWLLDTLIPYSMIVIGVIVFILEGIVGMKAEYGRYNKADKGLPARYAWMLQESPAFLVPLAFLVYAKPHIFQFNNEININIILILYFMIHYFNRSFIYPCRITSKKRVNYLENFLAFVFCACNGAQLSYDLIIKNNIVRSCYQWNFIIGTIVFFVGLLINIDSDNRLLNLRKKSTNTNTGYKIPHGGFFEYVSAANYFGECVEWIGFALAVWSLPSFAFALFTWSNIGPRAYHHHLFYKEQFGERYPSNRKALIPFIF